MQVGTLVHWPLLPNSRLMVIPKCAYLERHPEQKKLFGNPLALPMKVISNRSGLFPKGSYLRLASNEVQVIHT